MEKSNWLKKIIEWVSNFKNLVISILAIATAATTYFNLYYSNKLNRQLEHAKIDKEKLETKLSQKQFTNEQFLMLNREVREAIKSEDCDQNLLLVILVDKILADDKYYRDSIRRIVKRHNLDCYAAEYIEKSEKTENEFEQDHAKKISTPYRIDVFYLEETNNKSKPKAAKIRELIHDRFSEYEVRLRLLPITKNSQRGYQIQVDQIRFEDNEREVAEAIRETIEKDSIYHFFQPKMYEIKYPTKNYISVFVK